MAGQQPGRLGDEEETKYGMVDCEVTGEERETVKLDCVAAELAEYGMTGPVSDSGEQSGVGEEDTPAKVSESVHCSNLCCKGVLECEAVVVPAPDAACGGRVSVGEPELAPDAGTVALNLKMFEEGEKRFGDFREYRQPGGSVVGELKNILEGKPCGGIENSAKLAKLTAKLDGSCRGSKHGRK